MNADGTVNVPRSRRQRPRERPGWWVRARANRSLVCAYACPAQDRLVSCETLEFKLDLGSGLAGLSECLIGRCGVQHLGSARKLMGQAHHGMTEEIPVRHPRAARRCTATFEICLPEEILDYLTDPLDTPTQPVSLRFTPVVGGIFPCGPGFPHSFLGLAKRMVGEPHRDHGGDIADRREDYACHRHDGILSPVTDRGRILGGAARRMRFPGSTTMASGGHARRPLPSRGEPAQEIPERVTLGGQ